MGELIPLPGMGAPVLDAWKTDDPEVEAELSKEEMVFSAPPAHMVEGALEALLLASEGPVTSKQLNTWLCEPGMDPVEDALMDIQERMRAHQGGMQLVQVAKGWQLRTDVRYARWVTTMRGGKPFRLSPAALSTLAVVAYRQPVTRAEVEDLRGVDSGGVLRMLCSRDLVMVTGRKDEPGRPLLYCTSPDFLSLFGLRDLSDLPTLQDLRELEPDPTGQAGPFDAGLALQASLPFQADEAPAEE
jgi:segregation and condensation protein B